MGLFNLIYGKKVKMLKGIPGPTPHFPLGSANKLLGPTLFGGKQPWEVTAELGQQYGPLSILWLGGSPALLLNDGELVADVLINGMDDFYKDAPVKALTPVVTDKTPFVLNGQSWWDARHGSPLTQDWFEPWLAQRMPVVRDFVRERVKTFPTEAVDLYPFIERFTADVFTQALIGRNLDDEAFKCFKKMTDVGSKRINAPILLTSEPLNPSFYSARKAWYGYFQKMAEATRANPDPNATDFLNMVIANQPKLTDEHISFIMGNVYFGGAISAPSAIASNLYLMAENPSEARPVKNQAEALGNDYSYEDLKAAELINYSLMESLRMLPPVPLYTRNSLKDKEITYQGYTLPKNTTMFISNWLIQRSDKFWENGTTFKPKRWADGVLEQNPIGSAKFFPFGMGPRMCMGRPFALMTMRTALAGIHAHLDVSIEGTYDMDFYFGVMLPKGIKGSFT